MRDEIYSWQKALFGTFASWFFGALAFFSQLPWYTIFSFAAGLIPPLLKVYCDNDKKKLREQADEIKTWKDRSLELEGRLNAAIVNLMKKTEEFVQATDALQHAEGELRHAQEPISQPNQRTQVHPREQADPEPQELPTPPAEPAGRDGEPS